MSIEKTPNYNLNKPGYENFGDIADLNENADIIDAALENKVDKEAGKGLSEAEFTASEKTKLAGIQDGANNYIHPTNPGNTHIPAGGGLNKILGWDSDGAAKWEDKSEGGSGKRTARFAIGTIHSGWTSKDCDYLCDGVADDVEINAAIEALPAGGGEIVILDGVYELSDLILVNKNNVKIQGNGSATKLSGKGIKLTLINQCMVEGLRITNAEHGISLNGASDSIIINNICDNNTECGISLSGVINSIISGNTCTRGTGQSSDYTSLQHTIHLQYSDNEYNLITNNRCMGKAITVDGGLHNSIFGNKIGAETDLVTSVVAELGADDWGGIGPYEQSLTIIGMTTTRSGTIGISPSATLEQREAARSAMLMLTSQGTDTITVTADGEQPDIDIPIVINMLP